MRQGLDLFFTSKSYRSLTLKSASLSVKTLMVPWHWHVNTEAKPNGSWRRKTGKRFSHLTCRSKKNRLKLSNVSSLDCGRQLACHKQKAPNKQPTWSRFTRRTCVEQINHDSTLRLVWECYSHSYRIQHFGWFGESLWKSYTRFWAKYVRRTPKALNHSWMDWKNLWDCYILGSTLWAV